MDAQQAWNPYSTAQATNELSGNPALNLSDAVQYGYHTEANKNNYHPGAEDEGQDSDPGFRGQRYTLSRDHGYGSNKLFSQQPSRQYRKPASRRDLPGYFRGYESSLSSNIEANTPYHTQLTSMSRRKTSEGFTHARPHRRTALTTRRLHPHQAPADIYPPARSQADPYQITPTQSAPQIAPRPDYFPTHSLNNNRYLSPSPYYGESSRIQPFDRSHSNPSPGPNGTRTPRSTDLETYRNHATQGALFTNNIFGHRLTSVASLEALDRASYGSDASAPTAETIQSPYVAGTSASSTQQCEGTLGAKALRTESSGQLTLAQDALRAEQSFVGTNAVVESVSDTNDGPQFGEENILSANDPLWDLFEGDIDETLF